MLSQALLFWGLAGCLSMTALNFPASYKEQSETTSEASPLNASESPLRFAESPLLPFETPQTPAPLATAPQESNTSIKKEQTPSQALLSKPEKKEEAKESAKPTSWIEEYKVQPEDTLDINVFEEPDLTTRVRISGTGEIRFPLLGRIHVAGLSVIEVQEKITNLLAQDYLVNPQVTVFIETYHARDVFVTGAVNNPGAYALPAGKKTTLMEAISMAGGFTEDAGPNGTQIMRIENGEEVTIRVKAKDIVKKGDKSKDVEVRPNDVVFIPESFF